MMILSLLIGGIMLISVSEAKAVWKGSAILVIKQGKVEEFKKAVQKIINPTKKEAGCLSYEGYQVLDKKGRETNKFEFHEIWTSKEAMLIDHKENSSHMKKFFRDINADTPESFLESFEVDGKYVSIIEGV